MFGTTPPAVKERWHAIMVDRQSLHQKEDLSPCVFECLAPELSGLSLSRTSDATYVRAVAKVAFAPWSIPNIERETKAYGLLAGSGLTPRFLAHIDEDKRIMGLLLEKVVGRRPRDEDLGACEEALKSLHRLGFAHGAPTRDHFIVTEEDVVKLVGLSEFVNRRPSPETRSAELARLRSEFGVFAEVKDMEYGRRQRDLRSGDSFIR